MSLTLPRFIVGIFFLVLTGQYRNRSFRFVFVSTSLGPGKVILL